MRRISLSDKQEDILYIHHKPSRAWQLQPSNREKTARQTWAEDGRDEQMGGLAPRRVGKRPSKVEKGWLDRAIGPRALQVDQPCGLSLLKMFRWSHSGRTGTLLIIIDRRRAAGLLLNPGVSKMVPT